VDPTVQLTYRTTGSIFNLEREFREYSSRVPVPVQVLKYGRYLYSLILVLRSICFTGMEYMYRTVLRIAIIVQRTGTPVPVFRTVPLQVALEYRYVAVSRSTSISVPVRRRRGICSRADSTCTGVWYLSVYRYKYNVSFSEEKESHIFNAFCLFNKRKILAIC
jgi:hypothetical protein